MPLSVHCERRKLHSSHIISLHSRASNALPGCLLKWTGTFNLYICQSVALCCCTPPPPQRSSQRSGRCTLGGGALHCARPRAECGRCVDAAGCNARKKLRLDHQSLQAAAQQQHCNAAQCNAAHSQGCCSTAPAHAAASSTPAPTAAWGRHSVPNSWQASHGTPALRDWPMNAFQDFCSTLSVKFSWLGESWWANQIALLWLIVTPEPDF